MHKKRTAAWWWMFAKPAIAAPLALLLFVLGCASASPSFHHWFHCDDQSPTHNCVITLLQHGQTDVVTVSVSVPSPTLEPAAAELPSNVFFVSHDPTLYPERGPPALS
jgi:hypothetical protein